MNRNYQFQGQDTTSVKLNTLNQTGGTNQTFDLGRQTIALEDLRSVVIDSSRLEVKKVVPVIKTIPYVP